MPLIACHNAAFAYEGNVVVSGLEFTIHSGDYLCIVGENGSGKSTLIKGLLRLKTPSEGSIVMSEELKSTEIGYLPQQTAAQKDFPASVGEVVLSGRLNSRGMRPFYTANDRAAARESMERLGLTGFMNHSYRALSGGQQQRVLLARALCAAKKLLLLDEPVSGLDPLVTAELYHLIQSINQSLGITIVMVSHDVQSAVKYASHVLHLQNRQAFFGPAEEYRNTGLASRFLGGHDDV